MYLKSVGGNSLSASHVVSQRGLTIHFLSLPIVRGPPGSHLQSSSFQCVCVLSFSLALMHIVSLAVVKYYL